MSIMSPVTGVEVSLTVSIRESSLVSLSETSYTILLSLVSIGPGITRGCESAIHWMIFLIDLSPLCNYWLLSGYWGKLLVGALKGSLGGVMPLRPSIPDPFQDKNIFILHKSTTPSSGNTKSNNTSLRLP